MKEELLAKAARENAQAETRIVMTVMTTTVDEEKAYLLDFTNKIGLVYRLHFFPDSKEVRNVLSDHFIEVGGDTLDAVYEWAQRNVPIR